MDMCKTISDFQNIIQKGLKMEMTYNEYFSGKMIYKNKNFHLYIQQKIKESLS